jgi:hypothetical protein
MALRMYRPFRVGLAAYLCREWSEQRPSRLRRLTIFHLLEPEKGGPPSRTLLVAHECGSNRSARVHGDRGHGDLLTQADAGR